MHANAVASSSRERPALNRSSMHSLLQHDPHEGVVMTREIHHKAKGDRGDTLRIINQYQFKFKVGKGQHGEVYLAKDTTKGYMDVAVKCVRRKNKNDRMSKLRRNNIPRSPHLPLTEQLGSTEHKIRKEIAIMKKVNHPHVVRLLEVIDDPLTDKIYMVMEYLGGGEIKWRSRSDNPLLRVDQTRRICRDVILGLEYLHYQGIIHRDIKPANLLWTADRRTVKISDFGVSTFSYAQRLAAAGKGNLKDDDTDPILMDESDLSKTAGTPMFLAPEIVYEVSDNTDTSQLHSSSTLHLQAQSQPRKRPPITKAIDIWAFGVTMYGLLFGILPFHAKTEYEIYQVIRSQDWNVPDSMGLDQIPSGGRHQLIPGSRPGEKRVLETEGAQAIDLLDKLLEKNSSKRITLEQVKHHPWILRGLEKPEEWLRDTRLSKYLQLEPSHDETSSAMSSVRFRWLPKIGSRIWSTLRSVKPQRSFRRAPQAGDEEKAVGAHSEPHHLTRISTTIGYPAHTRGPHQGSVREKGKQRSRQELLRNKSTNDVSSKAGKPTFEPWAMWNNGGMSGPSKSKSAETALQVPTTQSSRLASPLPSPVGSSQVTTPVSEYPPGHSLDFERPRSMMAKWMSKLNVGHRQSSYTSSYNSILDPNTSHANGRTHTVPATSPPSRDSVDALSSGPVTSRQSSMSGKLSKAMRAASWTGPDFARARPSEDMTSLYSGDRADEIDEETLLYGAGGIAGSPVPSAPNSALLSTVSSAQSIGPPITAAHAILSRTDGGAECTEQGHPDPAVHPRHPPSQARLRTTSPLARVSYHPEETIDGSDSDDSGSDEDDDEDDAEADYDSADDSSSIYRPQPSREMIVNEDVDVDLDVDASSHSEGASFDLQPSTSQMYQDEDEESEDEEEVHLEVRTRRPSQSATDMSPPRRSLSAHRPLICT